MKLQMMELQSSFPIIIVGERNFFIRLSAEATKLQKVSRNRELWLHKLAVVCEREWDFSILLPHLEKNRVGENKSKYLAADTIITSN